MSEFVFGVSSDQIERRATFDLYELHDLQIIDLASPYAVVFNGLDIEDKFSLFPSTAYIEALPLTLPYNNMEAGDDFAGDVSTTGILPRNGIIEGNIIDGSDRDWFAVELNAGEILRVVSDISNFEHVLRDANGDFVSFTGPQTRLEDLAVGRSLVSIIEETGTYYLDAGLFEFTSATNVNYTLTSEIVEDDFAGDSTTLGVIPTDGTTVQGRIDFEDDVDWFAITLEASQAVRLTLTQNQIFALRLQSPELNFLSGTNQELIVSAETAGTYFFSVNDNGSIRSVDEYTLSAEIIEDDFASDSSTEGRVTIGQTINGQINFEGDTDWFEITLTGDEVVVIETEADFNFPEFNFNLVNSDGDILEFGSTLFLSDGNIVQRLVIDQAYSGLFYISVQGEPGAGSNQAVDYTFSAASFQDDFAGNAMTDGVISIGENASGQIDFEGDEDWFAINLTEGEIVRIRSTEDIGLALFSANGQRFVSGNVPSDPAFSSELITDGTLSGTFYVAVEFGLEGTNYILESDIIEDDFSSDANTTGVVPQTGTTTGSIDFNNDSDWFAITLTAGETIRIRTDSDTPIFLSLVDEFGSFLAFSSGFNVLGSNEPFDGVNDQELSALVSESGTYFINVEGFNPGSYTLTSAVLEDDFAADFSTTGELLLGGSVTGIIDAVSDEDWFRVDLTAGDLVRLTSDSVNVRMTLLDENGQFVQNSQFVFPSDGSDGLNQLTQTVALTGTYYVSVFADSNSVGDYTITSEVVVDDFSADTSTTGVIDAGGTATGTIELPGDEDWFTIDLVAGQRILFAVEGNLSDRFELSLFDVNGDPVVQFTGSEVDFTADEAARYYVSVSSFENNIPYELAALEILPIDGTSGDDQLFGTDRSDTINGLEGDDTIFVSLEDDTIDGGDGIDTYDVSQGESAEDGYLIDLIGGTAIGFGFVIGTDTLISIENVISGSGADQIIASNQGSTIFSGAGDDILTGGAGVDNINGEDGDDSLIASAGADILNGGEGFDFITYRNSDAAVTLNFLTGEFTGGYAEGDTLIDIEIITGSGFDDIIIGNGTTVTLQGGFGDDTIYAAELDNPEFRNFLIGGEFAFGSQLGSNLANTGNDTLIGSAGRDVLIGLDGADFLDGGDGIDEVRYFYDRSGEGIIIDLALGTASGGNANGDTIINVENVIGSIYDDVITGDENDNVLDGFFGRDILNGGAGNDTLIGGFNGDTLTGGDGADTFDFVSSRFGYTDEITDLENADRISFGQGRGDPNGEPIDLIFIGAAEFSGRAGELRYYHEDGVTFIEYDNEGDGALNDRMRITNGEFDLFAVDNEFGSFDLRIGVVGSDSRDFLRGTAEDDFIAGGAGSDRIFGEAGNDQLFGDAGNDIIVAGDGDDSIFGGDGNDRILAGSGDDQVDGGNGDDNILGGSGDDTLSGGDGADRIEGQANNDIINGGDGNDTLLGGNGRDLISGGLGDDVLRGEDGNDLIEGNAGDDFLGGGAGNDLLIGGRGADRLYGGSGEDRLFGQQGNDLLFGGGGNDRLIGGGGNDSLNGQSGNDILDGGSANDILTGGGGADIFIFNASAATTIVTDFTDGVDLLDLSDFSAADIQSALDSAVQQDGDSVLTFSNGAVLVLEGFDLSDLSDEDILGFDGVDMMAAIA
ncbi:calcium-binding protein [Litorimonas sp. WD9-15]|uniref:calcium-binding protein n=1 Tax=Litorimonas sp. WD9-15 TaxID=3418716 RepID=UPI003CFD8FA3